MSRRGRVWLGLALGLAVLGLDQASKWWILEGLRLPELGSVEVLPFLNLTMVWNRGITFGLFGAESAAGGLVLAAIALAVVAALAVWLWRAERPLVAASLGAVAGGAIGNVIDRARFGAVVDFLHARTPMPSDGHGTCSMSPTPPSSAASPPWCSTACAGPPTPGLPPPRGTSKETPMPQLPPRAPLFRAALLLAALPGLAGCGGDVMRTFGLSRDMPDEFVVTTRAPLSMPPNYMLQPPQPGAPRPQELGARNAAEAALVPQAALAGPAAGGASAGQQALVSQAGPPAPPDIRTRVNALAAIDAPPPGLTERLMFWTIPAQPGITVNAEQEAQRLRENAALGRGVDEGETGIIRPRRRSLIGGFLDNLF